MTLTRMQCRYCDVFQNADVFDLQWRPSRASGVIIVAIYVTVGDDDDGDAGGRQAVGCAFRLPGAADVFGMPRADTRRFRSENRGAQLR